MVICGAMISCGIRQIYHFPTGDNEPSQVEFDEVMKSYPHKSAWTIASLVTNGVHAQTGSIAFLKRNGFVPFGPAKQNPRTSNGNTVILLIRDENGSNPAASAEPPISAFYQKMRKNVSR